ncbi:MAG: PLP-dependent aspartate aminotransferase family protein [Bacillota bacterium]|nr:PLP-dependent aspartate aminotransferase family protein [Bacillota bacterium]
MNGDVKKKGFNTMAIHSGEPDKHAENALNPPIFQTSTFVFDSIEHAGRVMNFESDDYVYTRGNNPTLRILENKVAVLEGGVGAVAFSSGMAAVSSVVLSLTEPGDMVLYHNVLYGSSYSFLNQFLKKYKVNAQNTDFTDLDDLRRKAEALRPAVLYFETPANPNLDIIDIEEVVAIAREFGAKVVIDNTFCSPYLQRPLEYGADVVLHSATKYLGGHGDVVAGIAVSNDQDYVDSLKFEYMCELGGVLSPFNAWLILRGIKTLPLRLDRHCESALKVAQFLSGHPRVKRVMYPGLENHPGHEIAKKQMKAFGGIVSFEIDGSHEDAIKVINSVELAKIAVSLGDTETLIQLPAAMTHIGYSDEALKSIGLSKSLIRISVGLEDVSDIISDLENALNITK